MDFNFIIVLFKNKRKKKIINKFKTFKRAENYFNDLIESSQKIIFDKVWENATKCDYEIGLLEKNGIDQKIYTTDELGRNIKVSLEDENYKFKKISKIKMEEKIYDLQINSKISTNQLIDNYLNESGIKLISSLNNKIIVQKEDKFNIFSTKNTDESHRFIESLRTYMMQIGRYDFIFVKDVDSSQRSYLYKILEDHGYNKNMLYRTKTTYFPR
jgi:hypothetical protein